MRQRAPSGSEAGGFAAKSRSAQTQTRVERILVIIQSLVGSRIALRRAFDKIQHALDIPKCIV
jgi:hypothetical protein